MGSITLTEMEKNVLVALYDSAHGNGHDFGLVEDARGFIGDTQLGAIVASLVKKDVIVVGDASTTDSGTWTQFTWGPGAAAALALLHLRPDGLEYESSCAGCGKTDVELRDSDSYDGGEFAPPPLVCAECYAGKGGQ